MEEKNMSREELEKKIDREELDRRTVEKRCSVM
jgi:hypothetical protein